MEISGPGGYDTNGSDFDLLRDSILTADLAGALSDETASLTVFAPTDAAFVTLAQVLGYGGADNACSLDHIVDALTLLGSGDDVVDGGSGNGRMFGGGGHVDFVFENGSGRDVILGFRDGSDQIDLSGYEGIKNLSDIKDGMQGRWYGTRINLEDGDSILLVGVSEHRLDESDFIFA